jgi:hypothetical protein
MQQEDLLRRYGPHLSKRIKQELTPTELEQVPGNEILHYLEARADAARRDYEEHIKETQSHILRMRWREAEELAYLVMVAEDVGAALRAS